MIDVDVDTDRMKKVFFIRFPKPHLDRAKAERWVNACRRDDPTAVSLISERARTGTNGHERARTDTNGHELSRTVTNRQESTATFFV